MEKPTVDEIISSWSAEYGNRWSSLSRPEALARLFATFREHAYERYDIKRIKPKIMDRMVGSRSKFGATALKDWAKLADRDFEDAFNLTFARVQLATPDPSAVPKAPAPAKEPALITSVTEHLQNNYEDYQNPPDIEETVIDAPIDMKVFPEMDRSLFKDIETAPVMDFDEFDALVERENNER